MPPPLSVARMIPLEDSAPKAGSPPIHSELDRRRPSITESQVPLLDNLNAFAQAIKSAATLNVRRHFTKQQALGQQRERERQFKLKSTFLTLVEDGESRIEEIEKVSLEIEKQINVSSQFQSKTAMILADQLLKQSGGSDALSSARDRTRLSDHLAPVKADLKATMKEVDSLKDEAAMIGELRNKLGGLATKEELRGLVDKDEIRELITKDELRRITTDEVRNHVTEALIPKENKLASLTSEDASLRQKIDEVAVSMHKRCDTLLEQDRERLVRLETTLNDLRDDLSHVRHTVQSAIQDQARDHEAIGAQGKVLTDLDNHVRVDPSNDVPSLDSSVMRNSDQIQSLQGKCEKLNEDLWQIKDLQAASQLASSQQLKVDTATALHEEIKLIWGDLGVLKAEQNGFTRIRQDIDAFKAEQENVGLIRTDLDSLIKEEKFKDEGVVEGFEKIEESLKQQHEEIARLDTEMRSVKQPQASQPAANHPPTPPSISASMSPRISDQQKLQHLQQEIRLLTKNIDALRVSVDAQHQKFDGLRSDDLVRSMVHQMQQIYPTQPGLFAAWKTQVEQYIQGNLKDNIDNIYRNIRSAAEERGQHSATIKSLSKDNHNLKQEMKGLRQDIEGLRGGLASYNPPQSTPDHGTRINGLVERVTVMENMYAKAVGSLQATPSNSIRNVTHLQHQNGISPIRNAPRELTTSRSSKSNEPGQSPINSSEDSESSDTPLSRRGDRGVRGDGKDGPPSKPNLKRRATGSNDENEDEGGEAQDTPARKVPKRRNVSGHNPFA